MFAFLSRFRRSSRANRSTASRPQALGVGRLECEALEDRMLLSLLGSPDLVNTKQIYDQYESANASAGNGWSVAVWTDQFNLTGDTDIRAQIYDPSRNPSGSELIVASTSLPEHQPSVAMDDVGNFVVTYTLDYAPGKSYVYAVQYDCYGNQLNSTKVAISTQSEYDSHVAVAGNGNFVVACTVENYPTGTGLDVMAQRYDATGTPLGAPFGVGQTNLNESRSSVACARDGWFSIAYQREYSGGDFDVRLSRYDNFGNLQDDQAMDTSLRADINPHVAMDDAHNNIVVWQASVGYDWDIYAQRVSSSGVPGGQFIIAATADNEINPAVAMNRRTGSIVVGYEDSTTDEVWLKEYDAANNVRATINLAGGSSQLAISISGNGIYMYTFTDHNGPDKDIYGGFGYLRP